MEQKSLSPLVVFRFMFGILSAVELIIYLVRGFVGAQFLQSHYRFSYVGLEWLPRFPNEVVYLIFYAAIFFALLIAIGLFYRLSTLAFFILFSYIFFFDVANYLNQLYLIWVFALLFLIIPAHGSGSIDALFDDKLEKLPIADYYVYIFRIQVGIVYTYAGIAKLNGDWLKGQPMQFWLSETLPTLSPYATSLSWAGLIFDLFIFPALCWKRTRALAVIAATVFHLTNAYLFDIGIFPWLMIATNFLFLPIKRNAVALNSNWRSWMLAGVLFFQVVVPLRHWFYPGESSWTDEGTLFSWRMKLTDKRGEAKFFLTSKANGTATPIDLNMFLTPHQQRVMAKYPYMLREFAVHLRKQLIEEENEKLAIKCIANVALNGREPRLIVDPQIDLSRAEAILLR